jgi:hypothetical protein
MLKMIFRFAVIGSILGFIAHIIYQNWGDIVQYNWHINATALCTAILFFFISNGLYAVNWALIIRFNEERVPIQSCTNNLIISNLAKYIPGKIFQFAGRVYMFDKLGVSKKQTTTYMLLEIFYMLTTSFIVFTLCYYLQSLNLQLLYRETYMLFLILISIPAIILVQPKILTNILNLASKIFRLELSLRINIKIFQSLVLICLYMLFWIFSGLSLAFFAGNFFELNYNRVMFLIAANSAGFILGYLAFIFPGGIGTKLP